MKAIQFSEYKKGSGSEERIPVHELIKQGVHIATLVGIIDAGIQESYKKGYAPSQSFLFDFEFPGILKPNGNVANFLFTVQVGKTIDSKLYRYAHALLGGTDDALKTLTDKTKGLILNDLLGKSAQLQIIHSQKKNPFIDSMMALPSGLPHPIPSREPYIFELGNPDLNLFSGFLEWVRKLIAKAQNAPTNIKLLEAGDIRPPEQSVESKPPAVDVDDSDLPF